MGNPLSELGLVGDEGKMSIDHAIVISTTKALEGALLQAVMTLNKSTKDANKMMKILGYAASTYIVLLGVARVIEASRVSKK